MRVRPENYVTVLHFKIFRFIICFQVGAATSGERGVNVTLIACGSAAGLFIPPLFVFPRVYMKDHMLKNATPGSIGAANKSGWSNSEIFVKFLTHFIDIVKPEMGKEVLLVLDNHETHLSLNALNLAKKNGIIILTFPPHTSHKLQPLDRTVFSPFKKYYNKACKEWMLSNPGKPISIYDVAELVGKAYSQAFTPRNISSGFEVSGIWPLNSNIFKEDEFLPSEVTNRPEPSIAIVHEVQEGRGETPLKVPEPEPSTSKAHEVEDDRREILLDVTNQLESSNLKLHNVQVDHQMPLIIKTPEQLRPLPRAPPRKESRQGRKRGKCRIATDTPEKMEIEEDFRRREEKKVKTVTRKINLQKNIRIQPVRTVSSSSDEDKNLCVPYTDSSDDGDFVEDVEDDDSITDIKSGDFCVVELKGKKNIKNYVAVIINIDRNDLKVKYLKRIIGTNKFIYEDAKIYDLQLEDVLLKLPPPTTAGGTARRESQMVFAIDIQSFNL